MKTKRVRALMTNKHKPLENKGWETLDTIVKGIIPAALIALSISLVNLYADVKVIQSEQKYMSELKTSIDKNTDSLLAIQLLLAREFKPE